MSCCFVVCLSVRFVLLFLQNDYARHWMLYWLVSFSLFVYRGTWCLCVRPHSIVFFGVFEANNSGNNNCRSECLISLAPWNQPQYKPCLSAEGCVTVYVRECAKTETRILYNVTQRWIMLCYLFSAVAWRTIYTCFMPFAVFFVCSFFSIVCAPFSRLNSSDFSKPVKSSLISIDGNLAWFVFARIPLELMLRGALSTINPLGRSFPKCRKWIKMKRVSSQNRQYIFACQTEKI